jgi:hypothetical protein
MGLVIEKISCSVDFNEEVAGNPKDPGGAKGLKGSHEYASSIDLATGKAPPYLLDIALGLRLY